MGHRKEQGSPRSAEDCSWNGPIEGWNQAALASATRVFSGEHGQVGEALQGRGPPAGLEDRSSLRHRRPHTLPTSSP